MPTTSQTDPVTLFGDLEQGVWGLALGDPNPRWSLASPDGVAVTGRVPLTLSPVQPTTVSENATDLLELCEIRGTVSINGTEREVSLPGVRCAALDTRKLGSARMLGAWFPDGPELGLAALRPASSSGQDRDRVFVLAGGEEQPVAVDPRLSTTYDRTGSPLRAGIELWLGDTDDGEHHSRRVAGQTTGERLTSIGGSGQVDAHALRCHTRGQIGFGVYALLRLR